MERIEEDWLVKRIAGSNVTGERLRGRPQTGWTKGVERALSGREISVEQGRIIL